ncbi:MULTISPECIES: hypothetical protein [Candidatus Ichthyocystis]|uniref:Uncharacterized protein n=1 Tax=Candidatus Ichthyocystis hellenicum TaxID=1561003 RepID=A0A0S4M4N2_9BURK|nr:MULTISPECIES: hypothetical protein [Ichthyocystis]CUT18267.1 hypothetical protein Ark11_1469 [Candidatus Ichthyocystis hellenicum]
MYSCHSKDDFIRGGNGNLSIKDEDDKNTTEEAVSFKKQKVSKNEDYSYCADILQKNEPSCVFLNPNTPHSELSQDNYYQEKLLLPDIFKLTKSYESNLSATDETFDTDKPSTSIAVKHLLTEKEPVSIALNPKIIKFNQNTNDEKNLDTTYSTSKEDIVSPSISKNTEETASNNPTTCKKPEQSTVKKNINLRAYHRHNLCHTKINSNVIYRDAIKKISIDRNGLFKKCILEKLSKNVKRGDLVELDLSATYSNIRRYALEKLSTFFNENTPNLEKLITPGISISDLKYNFILNKNFFKILRENCEKIVDNVRATPDNCLSHIFQRILICNINDSLNSTSTKIRLPHKKDIFLPELKDLIVDTISNLPSSVIAEIEKLDQNNIVNALFSDLHGVLVCNSLIININIFLRPYKNKFLNSKLEDNFHLFNSLIEKIRNLVRKSFIFHEGFFLLDESTAEQLSKYILSDIYGIPTKFYRKITLSSKNAPENRRLSNDIDTININRSEQCVMTKEFDLGAHHKINLCSEKFTLNIYEDAIKKIDIDSNDMFRDSVFEKINYYITGRGLTKSSLNLSTTYSNVRKYVLDKISPYIRDIIFTENISITLGMSISDIRCKYISNIDFFEKLAKSCEKIAKDIHEISDDYFAGIIQNCVCFSSSEHSYIVNKKNDLFSKVKLLIVETILKLPNKIAIALKKFTKIEIVNSLFSDIHGLYIPKLLINSLAINMKSFFDYNKISDSNIVTNLNFLNSLLTKILVQVKTLPILHKEKIFSLDESTAELLSKYLLSDIYSVPSKLHKKIKPQESINSTVVALDNTFTKGAVTNTYDIMESKLLEKPPLIPQKKSQWNLDLISSLNIYELAISMIDIDKGDFEDSFIDKVRHYQIVKGHDSEKRKINIAFSKIYNRIKNYILELFYPFLKETEEAAKSKIKLTDGMTIDELRHNYISNEAFFNELNDFCSKVVDRIKGIDDRTLVNLIPCRIILVKEGHKMIRNGNKIKFRNVIENLLVRNVSNYRKMITNAIKLVPDSKIVEGYFSLFYDMYIDNESLIKAKLVLDYVREKVVNDNLLIKLADKICLDMISNPSKGKNICKTINTHVVCEKLTTYKYIRKLVRKDIHLIKDKLSEPIMIMRNNKIEIADQKTRNILFDKIKSSLIEAAIKSYRDLCARAYKSYKSK